MFYFSHKYKKFEKQEFTTIRSINYAKEHSLKRGQIGMITLKGVPFMQVQIVNWEDKRICEMDLDLLKQDVAYDDFTITSHQEFVVGLNDIVIKSGIPYANNRITTKKRIFYLKQINRKEK